MMNVEHALTEAYSLAYCNSVTALTLTLTRRVSRFTTSGRWDTVTSVHGGPGPWTVRGRV
jgi:hypothetical protein